VRAVVGIGANITANVDGRARAPIDSMRDAVRRLAEVACVERVSRVYETAPVGPPQPDYLNAAALVAWEGSAESLLEELLRIERALGRERRERWGPRVIDLDVLWIDGTIIESPALTVPHPRLLERAFAVVPLLDVAPGAMDPRSGRAITAPPGDIRATAHVLR
jgi:2-amino-4-hydroxy-6-hydroxymethyldihydropteridine diphosphokinase